MKDPVKHTPGPWVAGEPAWFRGRREPSEGKRPITAEGSTIGNVYGEANARLIAATPDLYTACEAIVHAARLNDPAMGAIAATLANAALLKAQPFQEEESK